MSGSGKVLKSNSPSRGSRTAARSELPLRCINPLPVVADIDRGIDHFFHEGIMEQEPGVVRQNEDRYYGCIPYDKSNTIIVEGGAPSTVLYQIRDGSGVPVDLTRLMDKGNPGGLPDKNGVFVRFAVADNTLVSNVAERATVLDTKNGTIQFELPDYVYNIPCIYSFHVAVADKEEYPRTGKPLYVAPGKGVVLVEWTPFVTHADNCPMPHRVVPAVEDVRRKLDDFLGKNDLMAQVEYSADDIVNAMILPVRIFNEMPPRLARFRFSLMDFPFYEYWVLGTAAELLRLSVIHYVRNKLISSHGGLQGDEKCRDREYMQLAEMYKEEFRQWARFKKHELNYSQGQGWGTLHSDYVFYQHWR